MIVKKSYTGNLIRDGKLVGSAIITVWLWKTATYAHGKLSGAIESSDLDCNMIDFRRV